jgi:RNA polymerase sigma-70 factor (ECF subfamily)
MVDRFDRVYEQLLVLRCQTGDEAAFAELVGRYAARLRNFVERLSGDVSTAEDMLQEVWVEIFRGIRRLADPGAFPAWAFRVARDRVYRSLRRRHKVALPLDDEPPAREDDAAITAEDVAVVRAGLEELVPGHREVLVLRFMEELSYDQIAAVVGCPVGTVRSRLHHAKQALRTVLEQRGLR